jgi:hypothetical protein
LLIQCYWIRPADPNFRVKPLANEEFTGFISRDFFQLVVKVDASAKEAPMIDKRQDCKRRSISLRNKATIPLLVKEVKDAENDRFRGINRIRYSYPRLGSAGDTAGSGGFDPSGANTPIATPLFPPAQQPSPLAPGTAGAAGQTPNQMQGQQGQTNQQNRQNRQGADGKTEENDGSQSLFEIKPKHGNLLFNKEMEYLQGEFSWFLDSYTLYKEDYSDPKECVFIYRVAKKGLYERIEKTNLSVKWEDYE